MKSRHKFKDMERMIIKVKIETVEMLLFDHRNKYPVI